MVKKKYIINFLGYNFYVSKPGIIGKKKKKKQHVNGLLFL